MNIELALRNFDTLINLPEGTRLYASISDELTYDNRWFQGARRRIDGSSREDIFVPINKTFIAIAVENKKSIDELVQCIEHVRSRFHELYPEFEKVYTFLDYLQSFVVGFVSGEKTTKQEEIMTTTELLNKVIDEIATEKNNIKQNLQDNETSQANMTIESQEIDLITRCEPIREPIMMSPEEYIEFAFSSEEIISDMDDTDDEYVEDLKDLEIISDMDDTEEGYDDMPSLISVSDNEDEDEDNKYEISTVTLLVDSPFDEYVNRFQREVTTKILPALEKETDRIIKSIDNSVEHATTNIRRRFVRPTPPTRLHKYPRRMSSGSESYLDSTDDTETQSECVCINIPSIPRFFDIEAQTYERDESDDEALLSEDSEEDRYCINRFMDDIHDDIDAAVESTAELCRNVGKFMTRYM